MLKNIKIVFILFIFCLSSSVMGIELTLDQFVDQVNENSKDLKMAKKELEVAAANKKEATSLALPKIFAQAGYNRNINDLYMYADMSALMGGEGPAIQKFKINYKNEYSFQTVISQTLFSFKVGNALTAAKQYQKLTEFVFDATRQQIILVAKKSYFQGVLLKTMVEISQESAANAKENFENVQMKYDNGLVSEFELLQAEMRWKEAAPNVIEAEKNYHLLLNSLKSLAGFEIDSPLLLVDKLEDYPAFPNQYAIEQVFDKRPDYNALLWENKLRKTNVKASKSEFLPSLNGSFIYNYSSQSDEFKLEMENNALIAGLSLSIPIFTGGYNTANLRKAKIGYEKNQIALMKKEDQIKIEIRNSFQSLEKAKKMIEAAQATLNTAQKAFKIASTSAENGLITQLQLKETRIMLDQAQLNFYSSIYQYLEAFYDWQVACGINP